MRFSAANSPRAHKGQWPIILVTLSRLLAVESTIEGEVRDESTHQPLVGANVIVEGTDLGAATDTNGHFVVYDVEPGIYHVRFEMMGYKPLVKLNVRVIPERGVSVTAGLTPAVVELEEVTVTRAYYEKEKDAFVSSRTVDFEEIRRDPAGVIDIQRMMQALPSVVSTADQQNEIVVRGGSPGENLFLMDNIEISNPNHFGEQGTGGGPINMLNTLFIDRVDFLAGAFPAKYGDKASSVMDISLREGSRTYHAVDLDMSIAGIGLFAEGPLAGGRGSYMASFRKSYLDLIIRQTGLTAVPAYWNGQAKLVYSLNSTNKLVVNVLHGDDGIRIEGENTPQTRGAENVDVDGNQSAFGITLKRLWQRDGLTRFTLAATRGQFVYDVYRFEGTGVKRTYYDQDEIERDFQFRGDFVWRTSRSTEISGGGDVKVMGADFNAWLSPDTVWLYAYTWPENPDSPVIVENSTVWEEQILPVIKEANPDSVYLDELGVWNYGRKVENGWEFVTVRKSASGVIYDGWNLRRDEAFMRYGAFFQFKWRPLLRITVNMGLRAGYLDRTRFGWLSPRLGLSYRLADRSNLNLAFGRHFQSPSLAVLMNHEDNMDLKNKSAEQVVLGLEHFFSEDTRGTVEIYRKNYKDVPIPLSSTTEDTADRSQRWVNGGEGYSYGIEFFIQKKLARRLFGTFSYSYYVAKMKDPRFPGGDRYYPWEFDFRNVLTVVGGYKLPVKGETDRTPERSKLTDLLARTVGAGSQELELSFRYRTVGGKPYTPLVYDHVVRRWYEEEGAPYNTRRLSSYHRFDIMFLWHYNFGRKSLVAYLDIQNVFDRDNVWDIQRNSDGTTSVVNQFKVFPVGGFTLEF